MANTKSLMLTGVLALFSASAFAANLPAEIYQPAGAQTIKAEKQIDGDYEYEAELAQNTSIPALTQQVIAHARSKGFQMIKSKNKRNDVDLKFKRGLQELEVSIENTRDGRITYEADLDLNHN